MSNIDKVRAKIAALLKKTEANGASESEASAAMAIAAKLMAEHSVTMEDIKSNNEASRDFTLRQFNDGKKLSVVDSFVSTAIARYTDTKVWNSKEFAGYKSGVTRTGKLRMKTESNLMFYGYTVDVELAEYIYKTCDVAMETEWKLFSGRIPQGKRKQVRSSFMIGMAARLRDRLDALKVQNVAETKGTDLIVLKHQLVETAAREHLNLQDLKAGYSGGATKNFSRSAFAAGQEAANRVRFNREVQDGPTGGVKLLA